MKGPIERLHEAPRARVKTAKGRRYYYYSLGVNDEGREQLVALDRNPAKAWAQYLSYESERDKPPMSVPWLMAQFDEAFLDEAPGQQGTRRAKKLSPKTRIEYRHQSRRLSRVFSQFLIADLKSHHVAQYLEGHRSPVSANRDIALLSRVYTWAIRRGWASSNPCMRVERNTEDARDRYISDAEYVTRRATVGELGACLMDLAYLTALRLSDILAIRLTEPSETEASYAWLADDAIVVKPQKTRDRVRKTHRYPRDEDCDAVVQRLLSLRESRPVASLYLVTNRKGGQITLSGFESMWRRASARDGIEDFQFRDIRAKAATDAESQGHDPQALLGHANRKMTDRYLRGRRATFVQGPSALPRTQQAEIVPIKRLPKT